MQENKFKAEIAFFESIRTGINNALQEFTNLKDEKKFINIAERLWEKYNQAYFHINDLLEFNRKPQGIPGGRIGVGKFDSDEGLQSVLGPGNTSDPNQWCSVLYAVLPECDKAIEGLKSKLSSGGYVGGFGPTSNSSALKSKSSPIVYKGKWFTMNNPFVWLIFSLILIVISYFIYKVLK